MEGAGAAKARRMLLARALGRSFLATSTAKPAPVVGAGGGGVAEPHLPDLAYRGRRLALGVAAAAAAAAAMAATVYAPGGSSAESGVSAAALNQEEALMPSPPFSKDMSAWSRDEVEAFVRALGRAVGEEYVTTDGSM